MKDGDRENTMDKTLGRLEKNSAEVIVFNLVTWKGHQYIDIRIWLKGESDDEIPETPTKKGLRFSLELLPEFIETLQRIDAGLDLADEETTEEADIQKSGKDRKADIHTL